MALSAGTRLGPYEILAPLGAGGMGEVYRAKDTRLDRTVAVKVLPPQSAENPEARQRFEREARAVSSMNHPHICTLHDVGLRNLYIKDSNGTGEEQALLESDESKPAEDWPPDGRFLIFNSNSIKKPVTDVMALPLEGDRKPVPLLTGPYAEDTAQVSPDGRWLVYRSNETGRFEIYVQSFPGLLAARSEGKWQVSTAGGSYPQWRRDGQELFYLAPDNKVMAVGVKTGGTAFEAAIPKPLFEVRVEVAVRRTHFLAASNGQRFLVVQLQEQAASGPINVVVNWARPGAQQPR